MFFFVGGRWFSPHSWLQRLASPCIHPPTPPMPSIESSSRLVVHKRITPHRDVYIHPKKTLYVYQYLFSLWAKFPVAQVGQRSHPDALHQRCFYCMKRSQKSFEDTSTKPHPNHEIVVFCASIISFQAHFRAPSASCSDVPRAFTRYP